MSILDIQLRIIYAKDFRPESVKYWENRLTELLLVTN